MVQFYPSESQPLTDRQAPEIPEDVKQELMEYCKEDIDEINEKWTEEDRKELNDRNMNLKSE